MSKNRTNIFFQYSPFFLVLFSTFSCAMPTMARYSLIQSNDRIVEIIKTDREITLEWESYSDSDVSYNLYFKIHGSPLWRSLDTVYNGTPRFSLSISRIGEGSWDFGVSAVDSEGYESEIHSSLDYSADPAAGWYLTWMEE